jgi:hypothetical protein
VNKRIFIKYPKRHIGDQNKIFSNVVVSLKNITIILATPKYGTIPAATLAIPQTTDNIIKCLCSFAKDKIIEIHDFSFI